MFQEEKQPEKKPEEDSATQPEEHSEKPFYDEAIEQFKKENYSQALNYLNMAIALNPAFADAYYLRGMTLYCLKEFGKAIADFSLSYILNANMKKDSQEYINILEKTALCYDALGLPNVSITIRTEAVILLNANPVFPVNSIRRNLSKNYICRSKDQQHLPKESYKELLCAFAYDDDNEMKNNSIALKLLDDCLKQNNYNIVTFICANIKFPHILDILRQKCLSRDNVLGKKYSDLCKRSRRTPEIQETHVEFSFGRLRDVGQELKQTPNINQLCKKAKKAFGENNFVQTIELCTEILKCDSRNKEAYYYICRAQAAPTGRQKIAVTGEVAGLIFLTLEKLSPDPDNNKINFAKGSIGTIYCYHLKKYDETIKYVSEIIQACPNADNVNQRHLCYNYYLRGKAYLSQNKFDLAIIDFNKAQELSPSLNDGFVADIPIALKAAIKGKKPFFSLRRLLQSSEEKTPQPVTLDRSLSSASSSTLFPKPPTAEATPPVPASAVVIHALNNGPG